MDVVAYPVVKELNKLRCGVCASTPSADVVEVRQVQDILGHELQIVCCLNRLLEKLLSEVGKEKVFLR